MIQGDYMQQNKLFTSACEKLEHDLRCEIYRKQLLPGEKLYSEMHFSRKYHISRSTVRKALDSLVEEGLIYKVRGSGTFVSEKQNLSRQYSYSSKIRNRQILFLSFSSAFAEKTLYMHSTFNPIFNGLGRVLNAYKYNFLFAHVDHTFEPPACLLSNDVAGIIIHGKVPLDFYNKYMAKLPCVCINHSNLILGCAQVGLDNFQRSFLAVKHLYELGHRKIGILFLSMEKNSLSEERLWGYERAMNVFNLEINPQHIMILPFPLINGKRKNELKPEDIVPYLNIFKTSNAPTALIVSDNSQLFISAFRLLGMEIPRDLSLVSGRNEITEEAEHETYVLDRLEDICAESAKLIIEMIEKNNSDDYKKILLSPRLIEGFSTSQLLTEEETKSSNNL